MQSLEEQVHGRGRREDEAYTGVAEEVLYARNAKPSWDITPQPDGCDFCVSSGCGGA